jgi:hypothetical protein
LNFSDGFFSENTTFYTVWDLERTRDETRPTVAGVLKGVDGVVPDTHAKRLWTLGGNWAFEERVFGQELFA